MTAHFLGIFVIIGWTEILPLIVFGGMKVAGKLIAHGLFLVYLLAEIGQKMRVRAFIDFLAAEVDVDWPMARAVA